MQRVADQKRAPTAAHNRFAPDRIRLWCMLALTFSTGIADAIGFLGLDRVFTGNMTGNIVILGMAITGAEGLSVMGPLVAFASFMAGAAVAGRVVRRPRGSWCTGVTGTLIGISCCLAACSLYVQLLPPMLGTLPAYAVTGVISASMGAQAAAARRIGVKDVTTVVVTSTITGLAADSWIAGRAPQPWLRRSLAIACIGLGALAGALLLMLGLAAGIACSAVIVGVVAFIGHRWARPMEQQCDAT